MSDDFFDFGFTAVDESELKAVQDAARRQPEQGHGPGGRDRALQAGVPRRQAGAPRGRGLIKPPRCR